MWKKAFKSIKTKEPKERDKEKEGGEKSDSKFQSKMVSKSYISKGLWNEWYYCAK